MTTIGDRHRGDINGDGIGGSAFGDLFLFTDSGQDSIWLMNQNVRQGSGTNLPSNGPTWHAKAIVEFNDGVTPRSDILWQNDNGALALWQMNGASIQNQVNLPNPGISWKAVQANNFDFNTAADILFQNTNGALAIWEFTSSGSNSPVILGPGQSGQINVDQNPGATWHVAATGDTDGDDRAGIVFQNDNGALAIWENKVDVGGFGSSVAHFNNQANLPNPGLSWHALFMGDFNFDFRADLLLQNDNGAVAIWTLGGAQGTTVLGQFNVAGTQSNGPTWHVVAVQDMNNDGRADLVWQNDNGAGAVWEDFSSSGSTATFALQLNIDPNPNPTGHLDWHIV